MKAGSIAVWMFLLKGCFLIRFWVQLLEIMLALCVFIHSSSAGKNSYIYCRCTDDNMKTVIVSVDETRKMIWDFNKTL